MKHKKHQPLSPTRRVALLTACLLTVGAAVTLLLYRQTSYLSLLLLGLLQLLPAAVNLLLFLPICGKRNETRPETASAVAPPEEEAAPSDKKERRQRLSALSASAKGLAKRAGEGLYDFYAEHRSAVLATLLGAAVLIFNILFWVKARGTALPGLLYYYVPVGLAALFVLYIVLDKWCKHVALQHKAPEGEADPCGYDKAILCSLRGALSVARLGFVLEAAIIMLRMLRVVDWGKALDVMICLLFVYETLFLIISLAVRVIRRELATAPELTIPMPGLGGEDLGILSYLEKNTGITMRSLWSIRLVGRIVPYALMSVVLLLWGFSGMVKIEAHQQGAHYRLGVLQEETLQPGLHMTLPWPFDTVEVYDTEVVQQTTIGYIDAEAGDNIWTQDHGVEEFQLLTGGGKELVSINMRVEFAIEDLHTYLTGSAAPESLMQAAAYELVTEHTIGTDLASLLSIDRVAFAEHFKTDLVARTASYQTGLRVVNVVLESIHPPVSIADVYQEVINATIQAAQNIAVAEGEAEVSLIQATTTRDALIAEARVAQVMAIADAKVAVAEFAGKKEADAEHGSAYRYYKYLNAVRKAYSNGNIILVGDGVDTGKIYIGNIGTN